MFPFFSPVELSFSGMALRVTNIRHAAQDTRGDRDFEGVFTFRARFYNGRRECVVGGRIERTKRKYEFCMLFLATRRYPRSRGAESSKEIENGDFLVIQGAENAHFGSERPNPMKI